MSGYEARGEDGSGGIGPAEPAHSRSKIGGVGHTHLLDQLVERCCVGWRPYPLTGSADMCWMLSKRLPHSGMS